MSRPRILHGRLGDATAFATRSRHAGAWDEDTRTRYLDDVRARAEEMAKTILAEAMAEAQKIREQAQAQGLEEGRAEAEATRQEELARLAALTTALHAELRAHAQEESTRRETLLRRLLILAVEKATGLVLQTERKDALWRLFSEAQAKLLDEGTVTSSSIRKTPRSWKNSSPRVNFPRKDAACVCAPTPPSPKAGCASNRAAPLWTTP